MSAAPSSLLPTATQPPCAVGTTTPEYSSSEALASRPSHTKARALDSISISAHRSLKDEVVNILTAAHRHGVPALCVGEIADQFQFNTGNFKPPSSFSGPISGLRSAKLIALSGERFFAKTGKMQDAYALVPQQTRLSR